MKYKFYKTKYFILENINFIIHIINCLFLSILDIYLPKIKDDDYLKVINYIFELETLTKNEKIELIEQFKYEYYKCKNNNIEPNISELPSFLKLKYLSQYDKLITHNSFITSHFNQLSQPEKKEFNSYFPTYNDFLIDKNHSYSDEEILKLKNDFYNKINSLRQYFLFQDDEDFKLYNNKQILINKHHFFIHDTIKSLIDLEKSYSNIKEVLVGCENNNELNQKIELHKNKIKKDIEYFHSIIDDIKNN